MLRRVAVKLRSVTGSPSSAAASGPPSDRRRLPRTWRGTRVADPGSTRVTDAAKWGFPLPYDGCVLTGHRHYFSPQENIAHPQPLCARLLRPHRSFQPSPSEAPRPHGRPALFRLRFRSSGRAAQSSVQFLEPAAGAEKSSKESR